MIKVEILLREVGVSKFYYQKYFRARGGTKALREARVDPKRFNKYAKISGAKASQRARGEYLFSEEKEEEFEFINREVEDFFFFFMITEACLFTFDWCLVVDL